MMQRLILGLIMSGLSLCTLPVSAWAQNKAPLDAVVIMDSSGSMKKTDPKELRKPAAKLFINLLDQRDRLSVMSFSDNAYPITFLTPLDSTNNVDRALQATDKISSKGVYTNIYAALARALELLPEQEPDQREPIIILMSDGQMDVGDAQQSAQLKTRILDELLPRLQQRHIKIYSIAFTENSDQLLLQQLADATDGRYALAADDQSLHKVFARIFEQNKQPDMLPLTENEFVVDPSIQEITIIANKKSEQSRIFLQTPDGERINSTFKSTTLKWFVSASFDMITISKPAEGIWKILFSDDDNRAYIVADIKMRTLFEYEKDSVTPELNIKTWFEKDDSIVNQSELLSNMDVSLEIEQPDGQLQNAEISAADEQGVFHSRFKPQMDGIFAATVTAKSKTFQRQQFFSFRAEIPEQPPVVQQPEPQPSAEPTPAPIDPETPIEPTTDDTEQAEYEDDFGRSLIIFAIVNLVVVFIALNVLLVIKMKKQKQ